MNAGELARGVRDSLEEVRHLLIERPSEFSPETSAPALLRVSEGLLAMQEALRSANLGPDHPEHRNVSEQVRELALLSSRVQALYGQGMAFYGGLASEMVRNGAWDAASYGPDGLLRSEGA